MVVILPGYKRPMLWTSDEITSIAGKLGISPGAKPMFYSELITDALVYICRSFKDTIISSFSPGSIVQEGPFELLYAASYGVEISFDLGGIK